MLLLYMIAGLVLQSICIYLIADPVLGFKKDWWWVMAGAYCLAWVAGFLAFWAPAGIGVRELIFVTTMQMTLRMDVRERFADRATLYGVLVLLGFLLRLWTVLGELMLAAAACLWDWRGAWNHPDAPGRVTTAEADLAATPAPAPAPAPSPAQVGSGASS